VTVTWTKWSGADLCCVQCCPVVSSCSRVVAPYTRPSARIAPGAGPAVGANGAGALACRRTGARKHSLASVEGGCRDS
jgi:hypothetical protein